ncbi:hypothetical protein JT55_10255 [Rhodovulum sp. NI22]|nr:hypothetical protein JT55_10255 [Rhodovulum sp. NI22]
MNIRAEHHIPVTHIEIANGIQIGPARLTSATGIRFDHRNAGQMTFWVDVVDADDFRLPLFDSASYETATIGAERASRDWGVPVRDLVSAVD